MEIKTDALMLKSTDYKENDRILTLFTLENGKMTAAAKGVKKAGAKLRFAAQPFCFAEYILAEKAGRHTVIQAGLYEGFYNLRESLKKFYCAFAVTDFCDNFLYEGNPSPQLFFLAVRSLKELCFTDMSEKGIAVKFLAEALSLAGYKMNFEDCGLCGGSLDGDLYFDFEAGTTVCGECRKGKKMSANTLKVINAVLCGTYTAENYDADGETRALKLLNAYIFEKTGLNLVSLADLIALPS